MKIRTITVFVNLNADDLAGSAEGLDSKLAFALQSAASIQSALEEHFYEIQTIRVATNPFEEWLATSGERFETELSRVQALVEAHNIQFFNFGPVCSPAALPCLLPILKASERFSASVSIPSSDTGIPDFGFCQASAELVRRLSEETEAGLGTFRFCGSSQVPPFTPFFPAAYSRGEPTTFSFSVGTECGDLLFLAFHGVNELEEARRRLNLTLGEVFSNLHTLLESLTFQSPSDHEDWTMVYEGVDASMNPSLEVGESIAFGFEWLHFGEHFGDWGSLTLCSMLTSVLKQLPIKLAGYSGLMLPVMEDAILAQRVVEGKVSMEQLLLFSSVCGVGLDTVPIPGNMQADRVARIFSDVACMATRLQKPLSCRLFPVPGKREGEDATFESPYLTDTKVLPLETRLWKEEGK